MILRYSIVFLHVTWHFSYFLFSSSIAWFQRAYFEWVDYEKKKWSVIRVFSCWSSFFVLFFSCCNSLDFILFLQNLQITFLLVPIHGVLFQRLNILHLLFYGYFNIYLSLLSYYLWSLSKSSIRFINPCQWNLHTLNEKCWHCCTMSCWFNMKVFDIYTIFKFIRSPLLVFIFTIQSYNKSRGTKVLYFRLTLLLYLMRY